MSWPESSVTKQHSLQEASHARQEVNCPRAIGGFTPYLLHRWDLYYQFIFQGVCVRVCAKRGTRAMCLKCMNRLSLLPGMDLGCYQSSSPVASGLSLLPQAPASPRRISPDNTKWAQFNPFFWPVGTGEFWLVMDFMILFLDSVHVGQFAKKNRSESFVRSVAFPV